MRNKHLVIILGPTAVGKTELTIRLAKIYNSEIVSADSRQFYSELKTGTAVPTPAQLKEVPHHFIGHLHVTEYYNVSIYENQLLSLLEDLFKKMEVVFMTGGSGLYIDVACRGIDEFPTVTTSVRNKVLNQYREMGLENLRGDLKNIDPDYYQSVDLNNPGRIMKALEIYLMTGRPYSTFLSKPQKNRPFSILKIGLNIDRKLLYSRIDRRVDRMISAGLVDEARTVYRFKGTNALNTVGYKELFRYLEGALTLEEAIILIKRNSRRYARRQITWFRKYPDITWFSPDEQEQIIEYINTRISRNGGDKS